MKKAAGFLLPILFTAFYDYAQKPDTTKKMVLVNKLSQASSIIAMAPGIVFFEQPNYAGASAGIVKTANGTFKLPFSLQHVSFKVPAGKIVYIKRCSEFPSEMAYFNSQPDISLEGICGIRTDETATFAVTFNGISSEIHNNDCMRFSGTVKVKVLETAPDNATVNAVMMYSQPIDDRRTISSQGEATIFRWDDRWRAGVYDISEYQGTIFNNNPVPEITTQAHNYFGRTQKTYKVTYTVGKSALRDGRLKIYVTTDLISAHKTCDLCDDFSSSIKMAAPAYAAIPVKKMYDGGKIVDGSHPYFIAGPFIAKGSRDGTAITATAGTTKNFRVHFGVLGL